MAQLPYTEDQATNLVTQGMMDPSTFDLAKQQGAFMPAQPDLAAQPQVNIPAPQLPSAPQAPVVGPDGSIQVADPTAGAAPQAGGMSGLGGMAKTFGLDFSPIHVGTSPDSPNKMGLDPGQPMMASLDNPIHAKSSAEAGHVDTSLLGTLPNPSQNNPMQMGGDLMKQVGSAHQQELAGIGGMAKAEQQAGQQKYDAFQGLTGQLKQNQADVQALDQKISDYQQQGIQDLQKRGDEAVKAMQIDPNRVWSNMGTGSKITAGIAIALGGIGAAMTHQGGNVALDIINKAIDRDIDAQKMSAQSKQMGYQNQANLYQMNLRAYGDQRLAKLATSAQMLQATQAQVSAIEAKAGGDKAGAQAQLLKGQLNSQYAQQITQFQMALQQRAVMMHAMSGGSVPDQYMPALNDDMQKKAVKMPDQYGGGYRFTPSPEAANKTNEFTVKYKEGTDLVNGALQVMNQYGAQPIPGMEARRMGEQFMASLAPVINEINGVNRFSKEDMEQVIGPALANPASLFQSRNKALLGNLQRIFDGKANAVYGTNVIGYKPLTMGAPTQVRK